MAKILTVNAGSSSLKFMLVETESEKVISEGLFERIGINDSVFSMVVNGEKSKKVEDIKTHTDAVNILLEALISKGAVQDLKEIDACGHRFVHGGEAYKDSAKIDDKLLENLKPLEALAPLHNPANLQGYLAFAKALDVEHVAVWDTAFHQTMEDEFFTYPVPYAWYKDHAVRRYGFHGTSHKFISEEARKILGNEKAKVIVAHIGNGASLTAVNEEGKSIATSMGFTPLAGVMMGTRSGDVDPAIVDFMAEKLNTDAKGIVSKLNKESGYLGLSGVSSDARDVEDAQKEGNKQAELSRKVMARRVCDYIGQYYVALGGIDAIVFTAGAGENDVNLRTMILERLTPAFGFKIDTEANGKRGQVLTIAEGNNGVKALVIPTNEEIMIARDTKRILGL